MPIRIQIGNGDKLKGDPLMKKAQLLIREQGECLNVTLGQKTNSEYSMPNTKLCFLLFRVLGKCLHVAMQPHAVKLVRAACVRCHGTKCPLLTALFLFLFSPTLTFLPEGGYHRVPKFCTGFKVTQKIRFVKKTNLWDPPCPRGVDLLGF